MSKHLEELQKNLGLSFRDEGLLKLALIHRSYLNERGSARQSNERLEFLGDAVLSLLVAEYLYQNHPTRSEGELTDLRSALVRRETLAKWATNLGIGQSLLLGKGEAQSGGRNRPVVLAGAFEAVLGAVFVERGLEAAREWLIRLVEPELAEILSEGRFQDYKGKLQKEAQHRFHEGPTYAVVGERGLEHERIFEIEARIGSRMLGRGEGSTKQVAQQAAARAALDFLAQAEVLVGPTPPENEATPPEASEKPD